MINYISSNLEPKQNLPWVAFVMYCDTEMVKALEEWNLNYTSFHLVVKHKTTPCPTLLKCTLHTAYTHLALGTQDCEHTLRSYHIALGDLLLCMIPATDSWWCRLRRITTLCIYQWHHKTYLFLRETISKFTHIVTTDKTSLFFWKTVQWKYNYIISPHSSFQTSVMSVNTPISKAWFSSNYYCYKCVYRHTLYKYEQLILFRVVCACVCKTDPFALEE